MKQLTIQVNMEENEAFEKEMADLVRAKTREIVRADHNKLIQVEAEAEFKRLLDGKSYAYRDKLNKIIEKAVVDSVKSVIHEMDIPALIGKKAEQIIDANVDHYIQNAEQRCKTVLDTIVTKQAEERIKKILG